MNKDLNLGSSDFHQNHFLPTVKVDLGLIRWIPLVELNVIDFQSLLQNQMPAE